jgi:hypothetical protein
MYIFLFILLLFGTAYYIGLRRSVAEGRGQEAVIAFQKNTKT